MRRETAFVRYCLAGLERMYLRSERVFPYTSRMLGGTLTRLRHPEKDFKFTMNALMALHRAARGDRLPFLSTEADYALAARRAAAYASWPENIAAAVWAGREIGVPVPADAQSIFEAMLERGIRTGELSAQALAWSILACLPAGSRGTDRDLDRALGLACLARERYVHVLTSLVRHQVRGYRRDWSSFAASCYVSYALLRLARAADCGWARRLGLRIARALVRLQGPQGQWAWLYHVPSGRVADYYPVYSVHQYGMAPFFLLEAIDQGWEEFRAPLLLGLRWVLGPNESASSMVERPHLLIWRSAVRREPLGRAGALARAAWTAWSGTAGEAPGAGRIELNRECMSYELAWALWAFAGRDDFAEVLDDPLFAA